MRVEHWKLLGHNFTIARINTALHKNWLLEGSWASKSHGRYMHISICITEKIIIHLFDNDGRSRSFLERKTFLLVEFVFFDQHCSPVEAWYSWRNLENHCPSYSSRAWTTWHSFQCRQIPAQWKTARYFKSKYIYIYLYTQLAAIVGYCSNGATT